MRAALTPQMLLRDAASALYARYAPRMMLMLPPFYADAMPRATVTLRVYCFCLMPRRGAAMF